MDLEDILLGSGKLRFKDINKFKDRPNIKEGIKNLKNSFGKQIKEAGLKWDTNEIHNNSKPSSSNNST